MSSTLSKRGQENVAGTEIPWRFALPTTFDKNTNPTGLISFSTAENANVQHELEDFVKKEVTIPGTAFSYKYSTNGGPQFPEALATFINAYFNPFSKVTGSQIITGCGVTAIENMLAFSLGDPGDGILVSSPIYGRFELDFGNEARLSIVYADMQGVDSFDESVVDRFEAAIATAEKRGVRIRALLISNPSNPLGQCYPRKTLRAILAFCNTHKIHLISDEVYALSVFVSGHTTAVPFTSVLSFDTEGLIDPEYIQVLYGFSKDFGAAGLKIGSLITRNMQLYKACLTLARFHGPSGPSIAIGTAILTSPTFLPSFLRTCQTRLSEAYHLTTQTLDKSGVKYRKFTNAGLFLYVDLSKYLGPRSHGDEKGEFGLAQFLLDRGVFMHPGEEHCEEPGWFRLVFASMDKNTLMEGLRRAPSLITATSDWWLRFKSV